MRLTLAAFALMLALAAPAQGADRQAWGFIKSGKEVQLSYGVPESDVIIIALWCKPAARKIELVTTVLPPKPRKGRSVTTTLGNGAATASYGGKVGYDAAHELFHFAASIAAEPKVVDLLKSGTSLTISVGGKQVRVPLRGIARPLGQFEAACFGRR
jgi:hypothetical protein